jgi:hypothetical protein
MTSQGEGAHREGPHEASGEPVPASEPTGFGFFALDGVSRGMLAAGVLVLLVAYVPVVADPDLTVLGYPWMFAVKAPLGLVLASGFVIATYYLDTIRADEAGSPDPRSDAGVDG